MQALNVRSYIAVPLHQEGKKAGLMYLDRRRLLQVFADRDVRLLERVGSYLLQIEEQPSWL